MKYANSIFFVLSTKENVSSWVTYRQIKYTLIRQLLWSCLIWVYFILQKTTQVITRAECGTTSDIFIVTVVFHLWNSKLEFYGVICSCFGAYLLLSHFMLNASLGKQVWSRSGPT